MCEVLEVSPSGYYDWIERQPSVTELRRDELAAEIRKIHPTREGWLDLAVVEDLDSRRVVGWSMGATMESRLVVDALEMAVKQRFPDAGLVAHSDRGSQVR